MRLSGEGEVAKKVINSNEKKKIREIDIDDFDFGWFVSPLGNYWHSKKIFSEEEKKLEVTLKFTKVYQTMSMKVIWWIQSNIHNTW